MSQEGRAKEQLHQTDGSSVTERVCAAPGKGGNRRQAAADVESLTWTWTTWDTGPILYRDLVIRFYRTGDWETSCNVKDQSEHSDWDVWFYIFVESGITLAKVFWIRSAEEACWFQDLDHGENFNKSARGFHPQIRDYWADLAAGTFYARGHSYRVRDN